MNEAYCRDWKERDSGRRYSWSELNEYSWSSLGAWHSKTQRRERLDERWAGMINE